MSEQNIEFSKEGIKISYLRFLSDSAAGQIAILIVVLAYYFPLFGRPLQKALEQGRGSAVPTEVKVLIVVLLFLLSTPLGLAVNAASWFALGWLQVWLQGLWFGWSKFPFRHVHREFNTALTSTHFKLSRDNWYERSQLIKHALNVFHPYIAGSLEHVRGIRTLFRNISFLSTIIFIALLIFRRHELTTAILSLIAFFAVASILVSSLLGFHYTSQILYRTYVMMIASGIKSDDPDEHNEKGDEEIVRALSQFSSRKRQKPR